MENFQITIEIPELVNNYAQIFEKDVYECMKAAGRKFLFTLATRFPVRTGFLRGSLTPLENILGAVQSQGKSRNLQVRRNRRPTAKEKILKREYYYPKGGTKVLKTTRSGIPFATPEREIFEGEGAIIKGSLGKIIFRYKIDISYLRQNDNLPGTKGRPWNAYKDGIEAFNAEFIAQFPKMIPNLNKFVMKQRINLTGTTVTKQKTVNK